MRRDHSARQSPAPASSRHAIEKQVRDLCESYIAKIMAAVDKGDRAVLTATMHVAGGALRSFNTGTEQAHTLP